MMLSQLSPRERVLALVVLSLVPICLLFVSVFWFIGKYNANNVAFYGLMSRINEEEAKQASAMKASQRRHYYRELSLPANIGTASNDYQIWLKNLVSDEIKMELKGLNPRTGSILKYNNRPVGQSKRFSLTVTANLEQLTEFLHKFYSLKLLHRINAMKILPQTVGGSQNKKIRNGKLTLNIEVEALSMVDAPIDREFADESLKLNQSLTEYQAAILRRNLFGPANNTPVVSARPSSSYTSGTDVKVRVTGEDADDSDQLKFELVNAEINDAQLLPDDDGRSAFLSIPGQPEGKYEFTIRVADNGFPSKENEKSFAVIFKDRPVPKVEPPKPLPPPKPKFLHAGETRITGIVKDVTDQWIVWIKVRTTGEKFQLKAGDSFELDDKQWTIVSVTPDSATIKVDDQQITRRPTEPFSSLTIAP